MTEELTAFLKENFLTAEDYIILRFKTCDVVFLGEDHLTKQRLLFLQDLIPRLYEAGVTNLGYEMACSEDQAMIDELVSAPSYDEGAAFTILAHWAFPWPYQEYADVFRAAWELNHSLPKGAPRFRILGIDVKPDYSRLKPDQDAMLAFRSHGEPEAIKLRGLILGHPSRDTIRNTRMADVLRHEVLNKGQKAVWYNGGSHSMTKYIRPPRKGFTEKRISAGYIIHQEIGDRAFCIHLGGPDWPILDPVVEAVKAGLPANEESVGFNTKGSPFGKLLVRPNKTDTVKLEDFWDGLAFVFMKTQWEPVTINFTYLKEESLAAAKKEGLVPDLPSITIDMLKADVLKTIADKEAVIKKRGMY